MDDFSYLFPLFVVCSSLRLLLMDNFKEVNVNEFLLNPATGIIISQLVLIWSLFLSHYSQNNISKKVTLYAAVPLTLWFVVIGISEWKKSDASSRHMNALVEGIEKKAINTERRIDSINSDLNQVSLSVKKIDSVVQNVDEVSVLAKNLRENIKTLDDNLMRQTDKSINEIQKSSANNAQAIQQLQQRNAQVLNSLEGQRAEQIMRAQQESMERQQQQLMQQQQQLMMPQMFRQMMK